MEWLILIIKVVVIFHVAQGLGALCVWVERKGSALIQDRIGANRAGAFFHTDSLVLKPVLGGVKILGVLGVINTLVCDAVKALFKEDFVPKGTSNFIHSLAPFMAVAPVFMAFAVIPFAPDFEIAGYKIRSQVAEIDAGILFIFAMASIAVYGVTIAGWCGNNKFSLLGGLRSAAQMISYELALGLSMVAMIVLYGTVDLYKMVEAQSGTIAGFLPAWGIFTQPVAFILFFVAGMAETKRAPFDLPESESELVAGYFTEYSGMKFLLFWLGEFAEIGLLSALVSIMFFGGWDLPFVEYPATWVGALLGHVVLMGKIAFFCVLQIVIRWTLPRFRYDQLMRLGWKYLLPIALVNLVFTGALKLLA